MSICSDQYLAAFDSLVNLMRVCLAETSPLPAGIAMAVRRAAKDLSDAEIICDEIPELAIREFIRTGNLEGIRKRGKANHSLE
jgi:hypothetical protein